MKIRFEGAAQTVTGSQTVVSHRNYSCMVDCGLYQGPKELRLLNWEKPSYVEDIKSIVITHAHIDHSGLLPRWARWGWRGNIHCTPATADLLQIMLRDSAKLQEEDARYANMTKHSRHDPALPLYTLQDAETALSMLKPLPFNQWRELSPSVSFRFLRAGHILGSAMAQFTLVEEQSQHLLTFSGDIGGGRSEIIRAPVVVKEADTLVLESTYGDRRIDHEHREEELAAAVSKVISRGDTLVIPAFAVGRTQDILLSLYRLRTRKKIPTCPIYLDSPMANKVTDLYARYIDDLLVSAQENDLEVALSPDFFQPVESPDDSMLLCMSTEPKIVISASGMLQGGRVLHHLKTKLPDRKSGVLFAGFQGNETKGRLLVEGIMSLRIHHKEVPVEAEIFNLQGYSAHADAEEMIQWLELFQKQPSTIFLNHGENGALNAFAARLKERFAAKVVVPAWREEFSLSSSADQQSQ